jgi:hypothetical protein
MRRKSPLWSVDFYSHRLQVPFLPTFANFEFGQRIGLCRSWKMIKICILVNFNFCIEKFKLIEILSKYKSFNYINKKPTIGTPKMTDSAENGINVQGLLIWNFLLERIILFVRK